MKAYVTKPQYVMAVEIDQKWFNHLVSKGWTEFKVGDFYLELKNGDNSIWPRKGFLELYQEVE